MNADFQWSPLLPFLPLLLLAGGGFIVGLLAWWRRSPDFYARGAFLLFLALLLLSPVIVHEVRQALPDKLVVVLDQSPSQSIAKRNDTADKILAHIKDELKKMPGTELDVIPAGQDPESLKDQNTSAFSALKEGLASLPTGQIAGTVFITDGQVHDVPPELKAFAKAAPFHTVLTGKKDEFDRRITVVEAPKYGMLSQDVTIKIRVDDTGTTSAPAMVDIRQDGELIGHNDVTTGKVESYTFKLDHPGQNVFEFSVPAAPEEMTPINNTAAIIINGVRDRLHVLLVSGMPHIGERAWRDLLKSDPSIDLVHFTILRSPTSMDNTPSKELSLIAFPVDELFEHKIRDFDLIIFDKYAQYGLLQPQYFSNIASFVKNGGAFLMAMGSDRPEESLFQTALSDILPVTPKPEDQTIMTGSYVPQLTDTGKTHPVTGDLGTNKAWGPWMTQADVVRARGDVLMTGLKGEPLLLLDKVEDGRVAVLTSDNIWLWSKGVSGGGPYADLLRHVAHWLMKEPELEEDYIKADAKGNVITVSQRSMTSDPKPITLRHPDGKEETITLTPQEPGWAGAKITADQNGIYRFSNGSKIAFAIIGTAMSEEFSDVHTTEEKLKPVVDATKGAMIWYNENPNFTLSKVRSGRMGGSDWIGVKDNRAYRVMSVASAPLLPNWLSLLLILAGLIFVWRRESGT
jgi:hypothetical protein